VVHEVRQEATSTVLVVSVSFSLSLPLPGIQLKYVDGMRRVDRRVGGVYKRGQREEIGLACCQNQLWLFLCLLNLSFISLAGYRIVEFSDAGMEVLWRKPSIRNVGER